MTEYQETVLLAWARDADGDAQRFTGDGIYDRAGAWCMDRLRRDIPTISTFYCWAEGHFFTATLAMVPERIVPFRVRLRRPDETVTLGGDGVRPWSLLAYKTAEDA